MDTIHQTINPHIFIRGLRVELLLERTPFCTFSARGVDSDAAAARAADLSILYTGYDSTFVKGFCLEQPMESTSILLFYDF